MKTNQAGKQAGGMFAGACSPPLPTVNAWGEGREEENLGMGLGFPQFESIAVRREQPLSMTFSPTAFRGGARSDQVWP